VAILSPSSEICFSVKRTNTLARCGIQAVMLDLVSGRSIDIPRVALEAKSPTAIAILREAQPDSAPVACVGCSDGVIRCVQLGTNKLIMRLTGLKVETRSDVGGVGGWLGRCIILLSDKMVVWGAVAGGPHVHASLVRWLCQRR
jgi:hypothetical protein